MYGGMFETYQTPGGPFDQERWAFADWGLMMEAVFTSVMRADFIEAERASAKSAERRPVHWPMTLVIPGNRARGLISGAILAAVAPLPVAPYPRAITFNLLGRLY